MPLQSEARKENEMCARQGGIEFKGKVYKRKYPRQEDRLPDPKQSQEPEPMANLENEAQSGQMNDECYGNRLPLEILGLEQVWQPSQKTQESAGAAREIVPECLY
ncbi:hypothetical protein TIFTF001_039726 [Ficus carica]|uniref:Uncharacterized protein n=1 Tax=Ficus carica TaxID=3494 RepID=A0AA87Z5D2_FICCA|nr:hypothetical protein TIFTF001_039726 [Ficus carica]